MFDHSDGAEQSIRLGLCQITYETRMSTLATVVAQALLPKVVIDLR